MKSRMIFMIIVNLIDEKQTKSFKNHKIYGQMLVHIVHVVFYMDSANFTIKPILCQSEIEDTLSTCLCID